MTDVRKVQKGTIEALVPVKELIHKHLILSGMET